MEKNRIPPALRRALYLRRRTLAALCAFLAVLATLLALSPNPDPLVRVYAAATPLPAGTVLSAAHLVPVDLPPEAVPEGAAVTEGDVVGRALAAAVSARSVLTAASVSQGERLARPGHVVVSLPLGDEAIGALVKPGVRIDVLDTAGEVLAAEVPVVAPPDTPTGGNLSLGVSTRSVLVEVPTQVAAKLVSQGHSSLTVVVR